MIEEIEKASEQNKYYKSIMQKISEKQKHLEETHNKLLIEEEQLIKSRAEIEGHIHSYKEKLEEIEKKDAMHDSTKIRLSKDDLAQQCEKALGKFLITKENENTINYRFKIMYKGFDIIREIDDENMTFKGLKLFFKHQFNKSETDFFFADKNNRLYLDDMNIKKTLFPFSSVILRNEFPLIKAIDKVKKIKNIVTNKDMENKIVLKDNPEFKINKNGKYSELENFLDKTKFIFMSIILFVIFLFLWTESCVSFRQIKYYKNMINSFEGSSVLNFENEVILNIYL